MLNKKLWNEIDRNAAQNNEELEELTHVVGVPIMSKEEKLNMLKIKKDDEAKKARLKAALASVFTVLISVVGGVTTLNLIGNFSRVTISAVYGVVLSLAIPAGVLLVKKAYKNLNEINSKITNLEKEILEEKIEEDKKEKELEKAKVKSKGREKKLDLSKYEKSLDDLSVEELLNIVNKFLDRDKEPLIENEQINPSFSDSINESNALKEGIPYIKDKNS